MSTRPGMHDVARAAGVSHQTVSRVLNDHPSVRPETRERVQAAIASSATGATRSPAPWSPAGPTPSGCSPRRPTCSARRPWSSPSSRRLAATAGTCHWPACPTSTRLRWRRDRPLPGPAGRRDRRGGRAGLERGGGLLRGRAGRADRDGRHRRRAGGRVRRGGHRPGGRRSATPSGTCWTSVTARSPTSPGRPTGSTPPPGCAAGAASSPTAGIAAPSRAGRGLVARPAATGSASSWWRAASCRLRCSRPTT